MIELKNLNLSYHSPLFKNASFRCDRNQLTLIKGKSGCGKTSLLYILGLLDSKADVDYIVDGVKLENPEEFRKNNISFLLQDPLLIEDLTCHEHLLLFSWMFNKELSKEDEYLRYFDILPQKHQTIKSMSGGQQQRLALLLALFKEPKLLLLDEPSSALDDENTSLIMNTLYNLKEHDMHMVIVSHHPAMEACADAIFEIQHKQIIPLKPNVSQTSHQKHPFNHYLIKICSLAKIAWYTEIKKSMKSHVLFLINMLALMAVAAFCHRYLFISSPLSEGLAKAKEIWMMQMSIALWTLHLLFMMMYTYFDEKRYEDSFYWIILSGFTTREVLWLSFFKLFKYYLPLALLLFLNPPLSFTVLLMNIFMLSIVYLISQWWRTKHILTYLRS